MQQIRDETGTQKLVGCVIEVGHTDGSARCWLDVDERHLNRHNVLHGGIAIMLMDSASGATGSMTIDPSCLAPFLSVSLNVQFIAAGRPGRVTALEKITGSGGSIKFISAELHHEDGTLNATSTGVFKRVPQEKLT